MKLGVVIKRCLASDYALGLSGQLNAGVIRKTQLLRPILKLINAKAIRYFAEIVVAGVCERFDHRLIRMTVGSRGPAFDRIAQNKLPGFGVAKVVWGFIADGLVKRGSSLHKACKACAHLKNGTGSQLHGDGLVSCGGGIRRLVPGVEVLGLLRSKPGYEPVRVKARV